MPVGSPLEMYTTVLGWHIFTGFWELLATTGLIFIPFGWIILDNLIEARKSASKTDVGIRSFRRTETEIYVAAVVMFLFAVPNVNLNVSAVNYIHSSCEYDGVHAFERELMNLPFGATLTTYDEAIGAPLIATMGGEQPKMSIGFYIISRYFRAIPESLKQTLPCNPDLRVIATEISNTAITDPVLRDELGMFQRDCWRPSLNQYLREKPSTDGYENIEDDISWSGSWFFLNEPGYYDTRRSNELLSSFAYDASRDGNRVSAEHADGRGMPYCYEWWESTSEGLRERLLADTGLDGNLNVGYWLNRTFGTSTSREARDAILFEVINADVRLQSNKLTNSYPRDTALGSEFLGTGVDNIQAVVASIGLATATPVLEMGIYTIKQAAPIFQAIMIMFVVGMLPILQLISGYDIKTTVTLMFVLASFHFWSFLFALAHWVDTSLWSGAVNNVEAEITSVLDLSNGPLIMIFNFVTGALYIVLPTTLSVLVGIAGQNVGDRIAGGVDSATGSVGSKGASGVGAAKTAMTKGKG